MPLKTLPTQSSSVNTNQSTGPRTPAGKSVSARNAMKHGCCADDTLILKGRENPEDYAALETLWFNAYSPQDEAETHLVQELVNADWFFQRATRTVTEIEAQLFETVPSPLDWTEQQQRTLGRFLRYQTTRLNNLNRCRKALEDYLKTRTATHIQQERHAIYKHKNKPEPSIQEILHNMLVEKREKERQTP